MIGKSSQENIAAAHAFAPLLKGAQKKRRFSPALLIVSTQKKGGQPFPAARHSANPRIQDPPSHPLLQNAAGYAGGRPLLRILFPDFKQEPQNAGKKFRAFYHNNLHADRLHPLKCFSLGDTAAPRCTKAAGHTATIP